MALTYKYDSPNTSLVAAENKSLDMASQSLGEATAIKIDKPTGAIDINSMQAKLQSSSAQESSIRDLPITEQARAQREKANEAFTNLPKRN